ncbi:hypothetical protein ACTFIY_007886 [Dictyostelium cf. discoideum]
MIIKCLLPTDKILEFDMNRQIDPTIYNLKSFIYEKEKIPIDMQIIELDNKKLSQKHDKYKLKKFKVIESTNVRILYDLDGSCCECDLCGFGGGECICQIL